MIYIKLIPTISFILYSVWKSLLLHNLHQLSTDLATQWQGTGYANVPAKSETDSHVKCMAVSEIDG